MENSRSTGFAAEARPRGNSLARILRILILIPIDIYSVGLAFYYSSRLLRGDDLWYVNFANNFLHWALLPAFILLPIVLVLRAYVRSLLMLIHVMVFAVFFGSLWIPSGTPSVDPNAVTLKILTHNVENELADNQALIELITTTQPDIIAFQEFDEGKEAFFENALTDIYPHRILNGRFVAGKALLSRYPIVDFELISYANRRPYIRATLDVAGTPVTVLVAHLPRPDFGKSDEIYGNDPNADPEFESIVAEFPPITPTIILGDFNVTDQADNYRMLADTGFIDTFRKVGQGFGSTYPAAFPTVRIDYIWVSPHFTVMESNVLSETGSDHRPLTSTVALTGAATAP